MAWVCNVVVVLVMDLVVEQIKHLVLNARLGIGEAPVAPLLLFSGSDCNLCSATTYILAS
jgi:hypothetical protein